MPTPSPTHFTKPLLLILFFAVVFGTYFYFDLGTYLSFEAIKSNQALLVTQVQENYLLSSLLFVTIYVAVVAFSLPGATLMTLAGGALFGLTGTFHVVLAATIGAILAALVTRFFLRDTLEQKFSTQLTKFNRELERGKVGYLFSLRLLTVFPFFLINNLAGLSRLDMQTFAWTTALGIIPGTLAYVNAGTQIASLESASGILSPRLILAFVFLGVVSLVPNFAKKYLDARRTQTA